MLYIFHTETSPKKEKFHFLIWASMFIILGAKQRLLFAIRDRRDCRLCRKEKISRSPWKSPRNSGSKRNVQSPNPHLLL